MTRDYALRKLLEHGELTFGEIVEITGWSRPHAWKAIQKLMLQGCIDAFGPFRKARYALIYG